ncbi:MAG TPA: outer membrane beta-barrel family protein [Mucilaginibacter sp.]|nr:outer membrane beta-barrel family protein [Mucilaginibacter sp.]
MRLLTGCLLIAFLLLSGVRTYAQETDSDIHGKVLDEKHLAAEASTVLLLSAVDSSIIRSTSCDRAGLFKIIVKPGKYLLLISKIGYTQSLTGPYTLKKNHDFAIGDITLVPTVPQLKEVSVNAQRQYIEVKPDKVVLNVQSSIMAEGNSILEILKQAAPGAHVDGRGNISIIGHQGALITIDNKPVNLTGQELADLLQSIPGSSIQQIELITNPSSKYDAAGAGIINLVSKKGVNAGTNFTVNAGAGYGKFLKTNAGLNFNNRMGKINIFGTYNYGSNKTDHTFTTDRIINYNGIRSDYDVNYYATQQNYSHNFRLGTDYAITPDQTIGVLVSGTINKYDFKKNNTLAITNQGVLDSTISTKSTISRMQKNISYDLNYSGKLDDEGRMLYADLVYNDIDRQYNEYIDNYFYDAAGINYRPALYLQNLSPSNINIWASKIDFVNPFSSTSKLEMGIKYSWVKSNNDLIFGPEVNGVYTASPTFSNNFIYTENINSAYANYTNHINKVTLITGLRVEQTNSTGMGGSSIMSGNVKKNYLDWFPQVQLDYQPDSKNEFNLSYNRGITRAAYDAVNPFLYYVDLYDYRAGNPNLLPQYSNKIQLSHNYNKVLVTTLYGMQVTNFYDLLDYVQDDASKVSISTTKNFGTYSVLGLKLSASLNPATWWDANFLVDGAYQRFKAYPQNGDLNKGTPDINLSTTQDFKLGRTTIFEIASKYESPTFYGIGQLKSNYHVDGGISQQMFHRNGTLRLNVTDIFNTQRDKSTINYQNLNMSVYDKLETRIVRLGFTYRFGNVFLKGNIKHTAVNEDEQKRAGGVAGNGTAN